jgi:ABC transport system ATP-binding/permease protein
LPRDAAPQGAALALDRDELTIGRDASCDLPLDNLLISRRHTRIYRSGNDFAVEDLRSTNGTYHNNRRLTGPGVLRVGDALSIGPYRLTYDGRGLVWNRSDAGAPIDIRNVSMQVTDRETGKAKMLLNDVSLSIGPSHFVCLLGTSGAGKSTFLSTVSGRRPATGGTVLLGGENLYWNFDALKATIGFVPQDVIFHESLPLIEALRYSSRLRLSRDISSEELEANISRVLDTVGLTAVRGAIIKNLSGGQKKRVSIAMELLVQPRVLFLDEVTSGLDPRTEKQMMQLFRQLADTGITVICITHYANSAEICDQIVYLNKGLLTFCGNPEQYKEYFGVDRIEAAYDIEEHKKPAQWESEFRASALYHQTASAAASRDPTTKTPRRQQVDFRQLWRQLNVLTRRYVRVLTIDRRNLLLIVGLAPLTAVLLCILSSSMTVPKAPGNPTEYNDWMHKQVILCFGPVIILFLLGMFGSVREIVKELSIYQHERFTNLRIIPYLLSKIGPLAMICALQTLSVVLIINKFADMKGGSMYYQFITLFLAGMCGSMAGLAISASVSSSDWAVVMMIGVVIPQILFSGGLVQMTGLSEKIGKSCISAYWALEGLRSRVEDYYTSNDIGDFPVPTHSQEWGLCTNMLLIHVAAFALLTFFLMVRKDGRGAVLRIVNSIGTLVSSLFGRQRVSS